MPTDEMFGLRRKLLENSYISVPKSKTADDGQLPTGWQLLTCRHFTAGRFYCRTSAALRSQQTRKGSKHSPASSSQPKRYRVCVCEDVGDTEMDNLICQAVAPVEMPVGLTHLDSDLCWRDPIVEVDEDGEHVLLHRQVTWN
jgi:hypothetical protein